MAATVTPYLIVRNAADALAFYAEAFGAIEELRLDEPGTGRIGHATIRIDGAMLMLADEFPEHGIVGPASLGATSVTLALEVPDVDALAARAVSAGATLIREPKDEFYGDRCGKLKDPFGHVWQISTRIENVEPAEMQRRYDALAGG